MTNNYRHGRPTIGVLVGWHVYWTPSPYSYLNAIFRGIRSAAVSHQDCNLLLACGMGSPADRSGPPRPAWPTLGNDVEFVPVGPWNTDGLIVINPLISATRSKYIHDLMEAGHPVVFISNGEGQPAIVADNAGGIAQAMNHLIAHGHQRIVFIGGNPGDIEGDSGDRLRAYQAGQQQFGLSTDPALFTDGFHTFEGGYDGMQRILASQVAFTAVLASNDESALGAMRAIKEAGLKIPEDVAIIGFDDRPEAAAQLPPLTSVHVPLYKLGYQAVELLLQYIHGQRDAAQSLKVPTSLTIRQSCGCKQGKQILSSGSEQPASQVDQGGYQTRMVQSMAETVLAETQRFNADEVQILCERLANMFIASIEKGDPLDFQQAVEELLVRVEAEDDDAHIWQGGISSLRGAIPALIEATQQTVAQPFAMELLDQARIAISEGMRRQHSRDIFDQKWMTNRIGFLTARLLLTSDESQIFEVLANDLPAMGIQHTSLTFFEAEGDDPFTWSVLREIPDQGRSPVRFPTRSFPPQGYYPAEQPFCLCLVPLVSPAGSSGFIAYDSLNIELDCPITQQIAAALNSASLYAEATAGRKLAEETDSLKSRFLSMGSPNTCTPPNRRARGSAIPFQGRSLESRARPRPYRK